MFISFLCVTAQLKKKKQSSPSLLVALDSTPDSRNQWESKKEKEAKAQESSSPSPKPHPCRELLSALVPLLHSWETAPALPQRLLT